MKHEFGHVPKMMAADEGETIALACFPPEGNPKPEITWLKENSLINLASDKYELDPSGILMINKLEAKDSGRYSCRVSNKAGIRQDSPVTLNIKDIPATKITPIDDNDIDSENTVVIIEDILYLPAPVITESLLVDQTTGLVHWLPVPKADGYIVRVSVGAQEITNITVAGDVNQIKLHSLSAELEYSVRIAALAGEDMSEFSALATISSQDNIKEVTIHMTTAEQEPLTVPANIWVIGMVIVIIFTLAVLLSAVLLFHKLNLVASKNKNLSNVTQDSIEGQIYHQDAKNKRYSWIDKRWTPNQISSFKSEGRLLDESHYDYVIHSHNGSIYRPLSSSPTPIEVIMPTACGQPKGQEVYHYASTPLTKQYMDNIQNV